MEENMTKQASPKEILTSVDTSHENSFGKKGTSPKPKKKKKMCHEDLNCQKSGTKTKVKGLYGQENPTGFTVTGVALCLPPR